MKRYLAIAIAAAVVGCAPIVEPAPQVAAPSAPVPAPPPPAPAPVALIPPAPAHRVHHLVPPLPHVAVQHPIVVHHVAANRHWVRRARPATPVWAAACGSDAHPCTQEHRVLPIE